MILIGVCTRPAKLVSQTRRLAQHIQRYSLSFEARRERFSQTRETKSHSPPLRITHCALPQRRTRMSTSVRSAANYEASSLWADVLKAYDHAEQVGASSKTDTTTELVTDESSKVQFVVRVASKLKDKPKGPPKAAGKPKEWRNPFLPYEEDLFVRQLCSGQHVLLLNKFNVVPHHLLVVTAEFQEQTDPLNAGDFECVWEVLAGMPGMGGLAFFNCGDASGHSQPHKHIQVVPLPLDEEQEKPSPFHNLIMAGPPGVPFKMPGIDFEHSCIQLPEDGVTGEFLQDAYSTLMKGVIDVSDSYNMVMTREWMMLVPRRQERSSSGVVAVNALGFAGTLLVRSSDEVAEVRAQGPMAILKEVGVPLAK